MKLQITIDGQPSPVELLSQAPGLRFRVAGGPEQSANVENPEPGVYSVLINGRSYDAHVEDAVGGGMVVVIDGWRFEANVIDPRQWSRNAASGGADAIQQVIAPMPGKIVRVLVAQGDPVEPGQGVVVVEAMKMQNEMKASRAGAVLTVTAKEGATVAQGDVLITIG